MTEVRISMRSIIVCMVLVLVAVLIGIALTEFNLSAQQEPGPVETAIGNRAKRFFIRRASRHGIPPRPVDLKASVENGGAHYGLDCSICHADDGHGQREPGQWEYPRAADLTSNVCRAIRTRSCLGSSRAVSATPECRPSPRLKPPDHIWDLVNYVRTLPGDLRTQDSSK